MTKIAIILGSTRPNRNGAAVAQWVYEIAQKRDDAEYELLDLRDYNLPFLDEPNPPSMGKYDRPHTKIWSSKIRSFDGYVFVTAEYNKSFPAAVKNSIDLLFQEWNNKACAFVGYGTTGASGAIAALRVVTAEVGMASVRNQVGLSLFSDFKDYTEFAPAGHRQQELAITLDEVVAWSEALATLREVD
jgi:NAD(P)H-dependent FMN reductase